MIRKFEKVTRVKGIDFELPKRSTANSAGYDFYCIEDIEIPQTESLNDFNEEKNINDDFENEEELFEDEILKVYLDVLETKRQIDNLEEKMKVDCEEKQTLFSR